MRPAAIAWLLIAGQAALAPAVPTEPIGAIIDAFRTHPIVALGEGSHGNDQSRAFRLTLLRDRRFAVTVNDIVLEGANAAYQDVVDRYVRGEDVKEDAVSDAWVNSTQAQLILRSPRADEFMRTVRALNMRLPARQRIRVLLGDPPMDWTQIHTEDDYLKVLALRDSFPAEMIRREVLDKHRRALLVYGDMHFQRKQLFSNYDMTNPLAQTVVSLLESGPQAVKVFSIYTSTSPGTDLTALQPDVASWRLPSFALLRGTLLGRADFTKFYPTTRTLPPMRMEDQFDALMYFGPPSTITFAPPATDRCSDRAYMDTHLARMTLTGLPQAVIDDVKRVCSTIAIAQRGGAQPQGARDVHVTAIPGVVAAGATWTLAWQGTDNADGIVGTADGGLLFAQEQPSQVSKLDVNDRVSVFLHETHGAGALSIDAGGRIIAVERTCTDPGRRAPDPCAEPTAVGVLAPQRRTLADSFDGKPLGRLNDLIADRRRGVYFTVGGAYYVNAAGHVTSLGDDLRTNGITLSRDERTLYVTNGNMIVAFEVQPDGSVRDRRDFGRLEAGGNGDGMAIDAEGRLYVTRHGRKVSRPDTNPSQRNQRCLLRQRQEDVVRRSQRRARSRWEGIHDSRRREEQREDDLQ